MSANRSTASNQPAVKTQYQHFIPRFILRGYDNGNPFYRQIRQGKRTRKVKDRDGKINVIDLKTSELDERPIAKHFGLEDMYRDFASEQQQGVEEKLSKLESKASQIIRKARDTFVDPDAELDLTRGERNELRKFLFLMKYRNMRLHLRFNCETIEEYDADDKEMLKAYMDRSGLKCPRDVWLQHLHAFLDVEIDTSDDWLDELLDKAYEGDTMMFYAHVKASYLAFCRPKHTSDEFLLTENVYGIFEGPHSILYSKLTNHEQSAAYTEYHNFAPISPSLIIVLRSNILPGRTRDAGSEDQSQMYDMMREVHLDPKQKSSILEDLPVHICRPSYVNLVDGKANPTPGFTKHSDKDRFFFKCFPLPTGHVKLINTIMLEEGRTTSTIVYKTPTVAARTIKSYLEENRRGFKVVLANDQDGRKYYETLRAVVPKLDPATVA